jgi:hypothetical protein
MKNLPVGDAFGHIVSSTLHNIRFAVFSQWPWIAIVVVLIAATQNSVGVLGLSEGEMQAAFQADPALALRFALWITVLASVGLLAFASIAVSWHRYILLDEFPQGLAMLRVDNPVWRYLGNLLLLSLMMTALLVPVTLLSIPFGPAAVPLLIGFFLFVVVPLTYRLGVKLPAVALGRRDFTFRDAWNATTGNSWQLLALGLLVAATSWGISLAGLALSYAVKSTLPQQVAVAADFVLQLGLQWGVTILGITLLTSLYGFFVEGRDF